MEKEANVRTLVNQTRAQISTMARSLRRCSVTAPFTDGSAGPSRQLMCALGERENEKENQKEKENEKEEEE